MAIARAPWWAIASAAALMLAGVIYMARCPSKVTAAQTARDRG
jgi:hypothetical protein